MDKAAASCAEAVCSVFISDHYFLSKSFAALLEAFSDACPDGEVPSKDNNSTPAGNSHFGAQEVSVCLRENGGRLLSSRSLSCL